MENETKEEVASGEEARTEASEQTQPSLDSVVAAMADVITELSNRLGELEAASKQKFSLVEKSKIQQTVQAKEQVSAGNKAKVSESDVTSLSFAQLNRLRFSNK